MPSTRTSPPVPIRAGEEEAVLKLDLGDVKVTRKFRTKDDGKITHSVSVESVDKGKMASPQSVLDAIIGKLTFDPLAFTPVDRLAGFIRQHERGDGAGRADLVERDLLLRGVERVREEHFEPLARLDRLARV